jgi:hypothetical protein
MSDFKFECPQCKTPMKGDRALLAELVNCPNCNEVFTPEPLRPTPPPIAPPPAPAPAIAPAPAPADAEAAFKKRVKKIRENANMLSGLGALFGIVGVIILVISILIAISEGMGAIVGILTGAGFIGTALWFYLIGQVVHIRANTER